jgi:hypothetical protein
MSFRVLPYIHLLTKGIILYQVLSSGVRLVFYTPASDGVLLAIAIEQIITNTGMYVSKGIRLFDSLQSTTFILFTFKHVSNL